MGPSDIENLSPAYEAEIEDKKLIAAFGRVPAWLNWREQILLPNFIPLTPR